MRVFYAVTLSGTTKDSLVNYRDMIANRSVKGRYTHRDNFHLTLEFIGQVTPEQLSTLIDILEGLEVNDFCLDATYVGAFQKRERQIVWMGVEHEAALFELQKQLIGDLKSEGFEVENRKYRPHITLGRQVLMNESLEGLVIEPLRMVPVSVALMESKRVGERLVYEPVAEVFFEH